MGGIQTIFTGDFFQLPPVPDLFTRLTSNIVQDKENVSKFSKNKQTNSPKKYCFESFVWNQLFHSSNNTFVLSKIFRQNETQFASLLDGVIFQVSPNLDYY